jgi:uncharacterized protein YutE (UPF0331/DUF86 family)
LVDPEVFDRRLAKLEVLISDLRGLAATPVDEFTSSRALQAQAERWLQVAVETCIDLANHIIADRGLPTPGTYREAFSTLAEHGVLDPDLAEQMSAWAGLRNLLVHLYLEVDPKRLHSIITTELDRLEAFASAITRS